MSGQFEYLKRDSDEFSLFLYDYYIKLRNSLNQIKQLQLFSISHYSVDYLGNQWFLYKPKYPNAFPATDVSRNIYLAKEREDDIDLKKIKEENSEVTDNKTVEGELWVRLKNFPMAYPVVMNTTATIKINLWNQVLSSKIISFDIIDNFGYVYFSQNGSNYITFFTIEPEYKIDLYRFNTDNNYESILDQSIIYDELGNRLESVDSLNKRILITPLKTYRLKVTETLIDVISYNGEFFVFYYDDKLNDTNQIKLTRVDSKEAKIIQSDITATSIITLPEYDFKGTNLCEPVANGNWSISVSADNVNIAYEAIPPA